MLEIGSIVIRVNDLKKLSRFWCGALDLVERIDDDIDFKLLRPRNGQGPNISLDMNFSERKLPPRVHFDLYTDNQTTEVRRLELLGATRINWSKQPTNSDYVIMEDPEGNRFCIIQK